MPTAHTTTPMIPRPSLPRRRWLTAAASLVAAPAVRAAGLTLPAGAERGLALEQTHTGERLAVVYAVGDRLVPAALAALARLLRDHRTGEVHPIDPLLLDQLHALQGITGSTAAFRVISGYRSPRTNAMLHASSSGVASRSLHLEGRAIDVRLPGVALADLRDAALSLRAGGVGYYLSSDFVHVDTGRVRHW